MSLNGINNYKVNSVGTHDDADWKNQTTGTDAAAQSIEDSFESPLDDPSSTESDGSNGTGSPLDDYTMGEIEGGSYVSTPGAEGAEWLTDFPPTVEEVIMNNENAINYMDILERKYLTANEDLAELKKSYEDALASGTLTTVEAQGMSSKIALINEAMSKAEAQLDKCRELATTRAGEFIDEMRACKDLNNDGWIGRPYQSGSVYQHENADGSITYLDSEGKPTTLPIMDPDYQASVVNDDSLQVLDPSQAMQHKYGSTTDLVLGLTKSALTGNDHRFGCPIEVNIPRYFWVKRDPEKTMGKDYLVNCPEDSIDMKMELYDEWDGTTQLTPPDLSEYMQVSVTDVIVESVELPAHVGSDPEAKVYDQYIIFKNGTDTISRIQITGFRTADPMPVATPLSNDVNFVAASSVGLGLVGDNQNVRIDCGSMKSTARHVYSNMASDLGITHAANTDSERAFDENIGFFSQKDWRTTYWDPVDEEWKNGHDPTFNEGTYQYGDYSDRYVSINDRPPDEEQYSAYQTGVFISGVRGDITGTEYNDVIETCGANDMSDYERERLPDDQKVRRPGDPFYANRVVSGGGNDVVVAGQGDNFIDGATFVWIRNNTYEDNNYINFPLVDQVTGYDAERVGNQKCYLHVEGGTNYVYNPQEASDSLEAELLGLDTDGDDEADPEGMADAIDEGLNHDDYYERTGSAEVLFANAQDKNIEFTHNESYAGHDDKLLGQTWSDEEIYQAAWEQALYSTPGEGDYDGEAQEYFDELLPSQSEIDEEMNGFFDEWFGDINSMMGEMDI